MSRFTDITMGFRHRIKEMAYGFKYLSWKEDYEDIPYSVRSAVISMVDGKMWHGGLTDRFKGIVTGYLFAQYLDRPFRIKYSFPFNLTDYLIPNEYNWVIDDEDISSSIFTSRALCTRHENGRRMLKVKPKGQIRFYCNVDLTEVLDFTPFNQKWGDIFNRLFRPSPLLQKELDHQLNKLGCEYVAMVFRFQNLLGDFEEYKYKKIEDPEYRERLIEANLEEIRNIIEQIRKKSDEARILITSDSAEFLERAEKISGVYSIKGKSAHVDTKGTGNTNHIKAFVDFFMISKAKEVYSVTIDNMYPSDFPNYASKVGGIPFHRINKKLNPHQ